MLDFNACTDQFHLVQIKIFKELLSLRAREMAQWVKYLVHKPEDLT